MVQPGAESEIHSVQMSLTNAHFFRFLNLKIQEGEAHNIFCPAFDCYQLVPVEVIESVVSREMDKRYLQFDIKVIVKINKSRSSEISFAHSANKKRVAVSSILTLPHLQRGANIDATLETLLSLKKGSFKRKACSFFCSRFKSVNCDFTSVELKKLNYMN